MLPTCQGSSGTQLISLILSHTVGSRFWIPLKNHRVTSCLGPQVLNLSIIIAREWTFMCPTTTTATTNFNVNSFCPIQWYQEVGALGADSIMRVKSLRTGLVPYKRDPKCEDTEDSHLWTRNRALIRHWIFWCLDLWLPRLQNSEIDLCCLLATQSVVLCYSSLNGLKQYTRITEILQVPFQTAAIKWVVLFLLMKGLAFHL